MLDSVPDIETENALFMGRRLVIKRKDDAALLWFLGSRLQSFFDLREEVIVLSIDFILSYRLIQ